MVKYLSGRVKRTPQDQLKDDRYEYLNLEQAEPNIGDPLSGTVNNEAPPTGTRYQLVAIPGHPGKRYWVPIGGGLVPGAISVFDENTLVGSANSITQLNFEGAAVEAEVSVQYPSGHPGIAATVTVIPVTIGNVPPPNARSGELWWESDKGDLYIYYQDSDSAQWVMANAGGQGPVGDKGDEGNKGDKGDAGGQKGEKGTAGVKGTKGDFQKGQKGDNGQKGEIGIDGVKGEQGIKGNEGEKGEKGVKGEKGIDGANAGKGDKGQKGEKGEDGTEGSKGDKGEKGQKGEKGLKGDGDKGAKGLKGETQAVILSETPPTSPTPSDGDLWWDTDDADLHIYYDSFWIAITNAAVKGSKGDKGEKGQKGEFKGDKGEKGEKGDVTQKGAKGETSTVPGPPGPAGPPGASVKGDKGDPGSSVKGDAGPPGPPGSSVKGDKGDSGSSVKGDKGAPGSSVKGDKGAPGSSVKGDKGAPGADNSSKGQKGEPGVDNSTKGQKGAPGASIKGQKGAPGDVLAKGVKGEPGADNSTKGQKGEPGTGAVNIANDANDRVITAVGNGTLNAEPKMTFDGQGKLSILAGGGDTHIELGNDNNAFGARNLGNQFCYLDFIADDHYTDYALRLLRGNTGKDTNSYLVHRGTGDFITEAQDNGAMKFYGNHFGFRNSQRTITNNYGQNGYGSANSGFRLITNVYTGWLHYQTGYIYDTGISVNQGQGAGCLIVIHTNTHNPGFNGEHGIYLVQLWESGNNSPGLQVIYQSSTYYALSVGKSTQNTVTLQGQKGSNYFTIMAMGGVVL